MQTPAYGYTSSTTDKIVIYGPKFDPACSTCSPEPIGWEYRPTPAPIHEVISPIIIPLPERCAYCQRKARADETACAGCGASL